MNLKNKQNETPTSRPQRVGSVWARHVAVFVAVILYLCFNNCFDLSVTVSRKRDAPQAGRNTRCRPHLHSQLTLLDKLDPSDPVFVQAGQAIHRILRKRTAKDDIDSLVLGIVGPHGLIWHNGYGIAKANESHAIAPPNEHSIYRIASVSKMFATMETFILRDKGLLSWDDPVTRFFPNLTYYPHGWHEYLEGDDASHKPTSLDPITLRQLASHMSGIGRDFPPFNYDDWPHSTPPATGALTSHTKEEIIQSIIDNPLMAPPYTYPMYSNTGFSLLGWCNTKADEKATGMSITHAEIVQRDIFNPLHMNGSSFVMTPNNSAQVVFPAKGNEQEWNMTDSHDSAGGQMSSLSDLAKTIQFFLDPDQHPDVLSPYTIREWVRPMYNFQDNLSQVGLNWEILQYPDAHGRQQLWFSKSGNLDHYHSQFTFNRELGFGVVVLMTGDYPDSSYIAQQAIKLFQPVFENLLEEKAKQHYAGSWFDTDEVSEDEVKLKISDGMLQLTKCVVKGQDILASYTGGMPLVLWSTGRLHEFRVAVGRAELNTDSAGCFPYWVSFDNFWAQGAPIDLIYFVPEGDKLILRIPSVGAKMYKSKHGKREGLRLGRS